MHGTWMDHTLRDHFLCMKIILLILGSFLEYASSSVDRGSNYPHAFEERKTKPAESNKPTTGEVFGDPNSSPHLKNLCTRKKQKHTHTHTWGLIPSCYQLRKKTCMFQRYAKKVKRQSDYSRGGHL